MKLFWSERATVHFIARSAWDDTKGRSLVRQISLDRSDAPPESFYLAHGAAGALLAYLGEASDLAVLPGTVPVTYEARARWEAAAFVLLMKVAVLFFPAAVSHWEVAAAPSRGSDAAVLDARSQPLSMSVGLDSHTLQLLEVVAPLPHARRSKLNSVLALFGGVKTKGGSAFAAAVLDVRRLSRLALTTTAASSSAARLLKASLVQPSRDLPTINGRLECVEELVGNNELFQSLEDVISRFPKAR